MKIESMLYLADIIGNITSTASVILFLSIAAMVILSISDQMREDCSYRDDENDIKEKQKKHWALMKKLFIIAVMTLPFLIFLPQKKTIYIILGAKMGQQVIDSPLTQKSLKLLENKIDEMLDNKSNN